MRFENPSRHKHNRYAQCRGTDSVLRTLAHLLAALSHATPKQAKVFLPTDDKYLFAVLNSKVVWHFLKSVCVIRSGGFIEVKPQYFEQIPIPELTDKKSKKPFIDMVDKILSAKLKEKNTQALEDELSILLYNLYFCWG